MPTAAARLSSTTGDGASRASVAYSAAIRCVLQRDRRLHLVGPRLVERERPVQQSRRLRDPRAVVERAVLLVERDGAAAVVDPRGAARVVREAQRGEAERLGLARQQRGDEAGEPDRLVAQVDAHPLGARGRRVALGEDEVDDAEHRRQPLGHPLGFRDGERDARRPQLALRADEPLGERRLGHEEPARDLRGAEAGDGAQRERHLRVEPERRMAAGEQQLQAPVGDRARLGAVMFRRDQREDRPVVEHVTRARAQRPQRGAPGDDRQPRAGSVGDAGARPLLERRQQRLLHGVLGEREVPRHASDDGEHGGALLARHRLHVRALVRVVRVLSCVRTPPVLHACAGA
jgi:hypothetical protein